MACLKKKGVGQLLNPVGKIIETAMRAYDHVSQSLSVPTDINNLIEKQNSDVQRRDPEGNT